MKDLSHLRIGAGCSWFETAISSNKENAAILALIRYAIYKRYQEFDALIDDYQLEPSKCKMSLSAHVLRGFYESPPVKLKALLKARRCDHALDACPCCGSPLAPETLDHFLPKEDWPEYAIFSDNLVPQCRGCAPIKGVKYFCEKEKQSLFLHPMYSPALSMLRFKIDVAMVEGKPIFSPVFSLPESISDDVARRIGLHLKSLQVKARIVEYCNEGYRHWIRIAQRKNCDIKSMLKSRLSEGECDPYANNWATAFFQGVLNSPETVQDLERHIVDALPKPYESYRYI